MGRSAKMMKRPTKAEKVARQVNAPPSTAATRRQQRSLSPEDATSNTRSAIPLFNTSAKGRENVGKKKNIGRTAQLADYDPMSLDSSVAPSPTTAGGGGTASASAMELEDFEPDLQGASTSSGKKLALAREDRLKAARDQLHQDQRKTDKKLGVSGKGRAAAASGKGGGNKDKFSLGVDYVKLHESRPGGMFKKKLR